jgi:hypothetical protein
MVSGKKIMSKYQRTKGHSFERKIAKQLRDIGIVEAKRVLEYQESFGHDVEDSLFIYQCKKGKTINEVKAYKEMHEDTGKVRVVVAGHDRDVTLACMAWEDFLELRKICEQQTNNCKI